MLHFREENKNYKKVFQLLFFSLRNYLETQWEYAIA